MKYIAISAFMIAVVVTANLAQPKLTLTIENAIVIGLENSKTLKSSQFKVIAAEAKAGETNALGLPSLKLQGTYTRLSDVPPASFSIKANTFGPGFPPSDLNSVLSPTVLNNYGVRASVQQPVFTGWKISGAQDAASYLSEATTLDYGNDKHEVIYNIKFSYWNVYKAIEFKKFVVTVSVTSPVAESPTGY